jgi:hypothetical protein
MKSISVYWVRQFTQFLLFISNSLSIPFWSVSVLTTFSLVRILIVCVLLIDNWSRWNYGFFCTSFHQSESVFIPWIIKSKLRSTNIKSANAFGIHYICSIYLTTPCQLKWLHGTWREMMATLRLRDVEKAVVAYLRLITKCLPGDTEDNDDKSIKIVSRPKGSYEDKCYKFNDPVASRQNICQKIKQMNDYEQWIGRDLEGCGCNPFEGSMSHSFPVDREGAKKVLQIPITQAKIWTGDKWAYILTGRSRLRETWLQITSDWDRRGEGGAGIELHHHDADWCVTCCYLGLP